MHLKELGDDQRLREISLIRHPATTLKLFILSIFRHAGLLAIYLRGKAQLVMLTSLLCAITHFTCIYYSPLQPIYHTFVLLIKVCIWWIGLGAISSIGLGSGMHTGILFVFPHIYQITQTAETCNSLQFKAHHNMWGLRLPPNHTFLCNTPQPPTLCQSQNVTFLRLFFKVIPYALLWGFGTALGELPPYAASFAATKARQAEGLGTSVLQEYKSGNDGSVFGTLKHVLMSGMVKLIARYGGVAVFLLSSWPNALFDLCGIICGQFLMPFWEFFIPLVLGKAIVKVVIQTSFTLFMISKTCDLARAKMFAWLGEIPPFSYVIEKKFGNVLNFEQWIFDKVNRLRTGDMLEINTHTSRFYYFKAFFRPSNLLSVVVYCFLLIFIIGLIEQVARSQQKEIDNAISKKKSIKEKCSPRVSS